jgi:hypothetical protein
MSTFAETANFVHSLSFDDQGKQTSVFRLQQPRFKRETEAQSIFLDPLAVLLIVQMELCRLSF